MTDLTPSWVRWPPNCCETCISWHRTNKYNEFSGQCENVNSTHVATETDSRFRCQDFSRKEDDDANNRQSTSTEDSG